MIMHRTKFFLVLISLLVIPLVGYRVIWLLRSQKVNGIFSFESRGNALEQIRFPQSEIYYKNGNDTIWLKGPGGLKLKPGATVIIRYIASDPSNARLDNFKSIWGATVVYGGIPFLILIVIFLHPEIIPYRSKVAISLKKPFVRVV